LWIVAVLFGSLISSLPLIGELYVGSLGGEPTGGQLISEAFSRRLINLGWVTVTVLLGLGVGLILTFIRRSWVGLSRSPAEASTPGNTPARFESGEFNSVHTFVILLIVVGCLLVLFTENFYLRDQFNSRINTIFKFYYQAWLFWGIAAAFSTVYLLRELRSIWGGIYWLVLGALLAALLVYPVFGLWTKTSGFSPAGGYSLDGAAHLQASYPDDFAAIAWLEDAPPGVVLEAVGGQYSDFARVATYSGQPAVLGWEGHESQWRGGYREMGNRKQDIERIYLTSDWEETKALLELYDVRYVFVGTLERNTYPVKQAKFDRFLEPVFSQDGVTIYEVPKELGIEG
jgi:uncharacterized membrane protein